MLIQEDDLQDKKEMKKLQELKGIGGVELRRSYAISQNVKKLRSKMMKYLGGLDEKSRLLR